MIWKDVSNLYIISLKISIVKSIIAQLCPALCNPMYYTAHGILLARMLEWGSLSLLQGIFPT